MMSVWLTIATVFVVCLGFAGVIYALWVVRETSRDSADRYEVNEELIALGDQVLRRQPDHGP